MTARVLVVDDLVANQKLLEARLVAEYFEVTTASSGYEALEIIASAQIDIVLLDVMMPGMDGFETCRRIKANPATHHVPVIMVTALDQMSDRVMGLDAGADDFLTKPISELALLTRVRSLVRLKLVMDEIRLRAASSRNLAGFDPVAKALAEKGDHGKILLVDNRRSSYERILPGLREHSVDHETEPQEALFRAAETSYELVIINLGVDGFDGLRLCSQFRSLERTRQLPILLVVEVDDEQRLMRALDLGVNDYLVRPLDRNEMLARVRTQIRRKRFADTLRNNVQQSIEMAITDGLTGLHNRRYLESHIDLLVNEAADRNKPLSLITLDIDHFKRINDTYGHDAGDEVLREFAVRLRRCVRGIDIACRYGGEEFVIAMPDTDRAVGAMVAERIRDRIASEPFSIHKGQKQIAVTASVGMALHLRGERSPDTLLKRADEALYEAKRNGRNRVVEAAA